jgi:hypothetical protein
MRPMLKFAGIGALACASLFAFAVNADAGWRPAGGHSHGFGPHGLASPRHDFRHEAADRTFDRRYRHNLPYFAAGAALGAATAAQGYGYEQPEEAEPAAPPYGEDYAAPAEPEAPQTYSQDYATPVVGYQTVTRDYTVPVRTFRTVERTRYVPVVSYRPVTTQYQVPVTSYETVQRTEQVPVVYRAVHHACGCSFNH